MKYEMSVIVHGDAVFELLLLFLDLVVSALVLLLLLMIRGGIVLSFFGFICTVSLVTGWCVADIVSTSSAELLICDSNDVW